MGLDLKVMIDVNPNTIKDIGFLQFTTLSFERNGELFDKIKKLKSREIDFRVQIYSEEGLIEVGEDALGDRLRYVHAEEFRKIGVEGVGTWNLGILKMLCNIDPRTICLIYWC